MREFQRDCPLVDGGGGLDGSSEPGAGRAPETEPTNRDGEGRALSADLLGPLGAANEATRRSAAASRRRLLLAADAPFGGKGALVFGRMRVYSEAEIEAASRRGDREEAERMRFWHRHGGMLYEFDERWDPRLAERAVGLAWELQGRPDFLEAHLVRLPAAVLEAADGALLARAAELGGLNRAVAALAGTRGSRGATRAGHSQIAEPGAAEPGAAEPGAAEPSLPGPNGPLCTVLGEAAEAQAAARALLGMREFTVTKKRMMQVRDLAARREARTESVFARLRRANDAVAARVALLYASEPGLLLQGPADERDAMARLLARPEPAPGEIDELADMDKLTNSRARDRRGLSMEARRLEREHRRLASAKRARAKAKLVEAVVPPPGDFLRPDVVVVGADRCGAHRLADALLLHPEVQRPARAPHHFSQLHYRSGTALNPAALRAYERALLGEAGTKERWRLEAYRKRKISGRSRREAKRAIVRSERARGRDPAPRLNTIARLPLLLDVSPSYLDTHWFPGLPRAVKAFAPDALVIAVVCDPGARVLRAYRSDVELAASPEACAEGGEGEEGSEGEEGGEAAKAPSVSSPSASPDADEADARAPVYRKWAREMRRLLEEDGIRSFPQLADAVVAEHEAQSLESGTVAAHVGRTCEGRSCFYQKYFAAGVYHAHLAEWREAFGGPGNQMLVLRSDEMAGLLRARKGRGKAPDALARVLDFLGLPYFPLLERRRRGRIAFAPAYREALLGIARQFGAASARTRDRAERVAVAKINRLYDALRGGKTFKEFDH
jgi:hypothetical protein